MEKFSLKRVFAALPDTERGRPCCIKGDPKGKKFLYCIGSSVVMRDADDPSVAEVVTHHARKTSSACYAPSGFYIASGDASGTVKIWDTVNQEHSVKYEYRPISSTAYDISWSDDSKRLVVVGDGREKYGFVLSWDTGTSIGDVGGHTKTLLSVDFRKTRPFAIVTAGEDMTMIHHKGPPFKYNKTISQHSNFVNCVRFSPDGAFVATGGSDCKIFLYDGTSLDLIQELKHDNQNAHAGGVYGLCWSPCSKKLLSCSADKSCKVWDASTKTCEKVFKMGEDVSDQQLGCLWLGEHLITVSLSGKLSFLDMENPHTPKKIYWGHNKGIVSLAVAQDKKKIVTGSYDGIMNLWDVESGNCRPFGGSGFKNQVTYISIHGDIVAAVGVEDIIRFASLSGATFDEKHFKASSQPLCVCVVSPTCTIVGCIKELLVIENMSAVKIVKTNFECVSITQSPDLSTVAVAGSDKKIHMYKLSGSSLELITDREIVCENSLTHISFSHDGSRILACMSPRYLYVYNTNTLKQEMYWAAHSTKVNCARWSADDSHIVSCGADGVVSVWKPSNINFQLEVKGAHRTYNCVGVDWTGSSSILSVGQQDCSVKFWDVTL